MHLLVRKLGLDEAINRSLGLLKIHLPYHDSDHVLNIAYNLLAGGTCLEHLELLRHNRSLPRRPGCPPHPRSHHRGRLLPPFRHVPHLLPAGDVQRHAAEGLAAAAQGVLRRSHPRCRRHDGRNHRRVQAGHGHQLRGAVGLSPSGPLAGQHGRTALRRQSVREPPQPRACRLVFRPSHRSFAARRASRKSLCVATPTSRRANTWTAGTSKACGSSSASTPRTNSMNLAENLPESLESARAPGEAPGQDRAAAASGERQAAGGRRAGVSRTSAP